MRKERAEKEQQRHAASARKGKKKVKQYMPSEDATRVEPVIDAALRQKAARAKKAKVLFPKKKKNGSQSPKSSLHLFQ